MTVVPPSGFLTEEPSLQDLVREESKETLNLAHTCERSETAPSSTSEMERREKRWHREGMVSMEPDPCVRTKKKKRRMKEKGLAERDSRGKTSQVVVSRSGVEVAKQGKMSKRRLLLRKRYYSLKRLGHKK